MLQKSSTSLLQMSILDFSWYENQAHLHRKQCDFTDINATTKQYKQEFWTILYTLGQEAAWSQQTTWKQLSMLGTSNPTHLPLVRSWKEKVPVEALHKIEKLDLL